MTPTLYPRAGHRPTPARRRPCHYLLATLALLLPLLGLPLGARAQLTVLSGPAGSSRFGTSVTVLTNGNYVVTDPYFSRGGVANVGAVHLYDGSTNALLSTLTGSQASDQVGSANVAVMALPGGAFLVLSPNWRNGATFRAGAVTWVPSTGLSGVVSPANSLVGSQEDDQVGSGGVTALADGAYVVRSQSWRNGATSSAGAVTWVPASGLSGPVSPANSLVGSQVGDRVGGGGITALAGGAYVVNSFSWRNGAVNAAGAVTWAPAGGLSGVVSPANSLVGSQEADQVGRGGGGVTALADGAYVVCSSYWQNGATANAGAVTWAPATGLRGVVSPANSLVGSQANDRVGNVGSTALAGGAYVVCSSSWRNGAALQAGAVTWAPAGGLRGVVSPANSLVGTQTNDNVGYTGTTVLADGAYVVRSPLWQNGAVTLAGAVTWAPATGLRGVVSPANSLVGTQTNDNVGGGGVTALAGGAYVVSSSLWRNGTVAQAGAVTWVPAGGLSGTVTTANSLTGSQTNERVGYGGVTALAGGAYVVRSPYWPNGATALGAVTWVPAGGVSGGVTAANSLTGSQAGDLVGDGWGGLAPLASGAYAVASPFWQNGTAGVGAVTLGGPAGITGPVTTCNSSVGSVAGRGTSFWFAYRESPATLLVGMPNENKVAIDIGAPPAPTGAASQSFSSGATVASLAAAGTAVQWYAAPDGGSPLLATTPLASGSRYYASQTVNGCESLDRLAVTVSLALPVRPATPGGAALALAPNPAPGGAARLLGAMPGQVVQVLDALGRVAATTTADAQGTAALPAGLAPGLYLVRAGTSSARLSVE